MTPLLPCSGGDRWGHSWVPMMASVYGIDSPPRNDISGRGLRECAGLLTFLALLSDGLYVAGYLVVGHFTRLPVRL